MDDFSIFIAAAGQHTRFGDTDKCRVLVNGEPLIRRTIRLLKEKFPGVRPCVLTWNKELIFPDCDYILTGKTRCLAETILQSRNKWHGIVYVFLSDVVYTGSFIDRVFDVQGIAVFASMDDRKGYSERYTLSFAEKDYQYMEKVLRHSIPLRGILGMCFIMNHCGWLNTLRDYVRGEKVALFGNSRSRVLHWLWERAWRKKGLVHWTGDSRVMDFDYPGEYHSYRELSGQRGFFLSEHGENMVRQRERERIKQLR